MASETNIHFIGATGLKDYFKKHEAGVNLILPMADRLYNSKD